MLLLQPGSYTSLLRQKKKGERLLELINHCVDNHPRNKLCVVIASWSFLERKKHYFPQYNANVKYMISQGIDPIG